MSNGDDMKTRHVDLSFVSDNDYDSRSYIWIAFIIQFQNVLHGQGKIWDTFLCGTAEFVGTAILMFIGCGGCIGSMGIIPSHLQITLTFGLTVMVVIQCVGHISHAHVNPAITIGSVVLGQKSIVQAMVYIVAQCLGAILGYGLLKLGTPTGLLTHGDPETAQSFCVTKLNPLVTSAQGFMIEMMATMILMILASAVWDKRNEKNTDSTALKFGLAVTCIATVFGPYTGCSMNPARSFAPAIWNNSWTDHWIYWFGPIAGGAFGAFFYRSIFGIKSSTKELDTPESIPLNRVEIEKPENI
ncbi:hypothetical protein PV325_008688 [Microctonus aethiopoides]|nr:hypothetical protein PV325_008688 [Microctonus aethiopoides]